MNILLVVFAICAILLVVFAIAGAFVHDAENPPHIIFLMIDDLGWANIGYHKYV
jgi:hypothetical protein